MKEIITLIVGDESYAITDAGKLPQPESAEAGQLLTVEAVEHGKVSRVGSISRESVGTVKTVNGIAPDAAGDVQSRYVVEVLAGFDAFTNPTSEIQAAYFAGREMVLKFDGADHAFWLPLIHANLHPETGALLSLVFGGAAADLTFQAIEVFMDNNCNIVRKEFALQSQVGAVSEALDHILALQEALLA